MRYMVKEVRRRPGRAVLAVLGIVIGVQSLVAIPLAIQTTRRAQRALFEGLTGRAALEVVPCGEGGFPSDLGRKLEEVNGLKAAVGVIQSTAAIRGPAALAPVMTLGVDLAHDERVRDYEFRRGGPPDGEGQVLLEESFAQSLGLELGATVVLLSPSGTTDLRLAGLLAPRGAAAVNDGAVAIMPLSTAQQLYQLQGRINSLQLVLSDGADPRRVARDVSKRLPPGLTVQAPAARASLAQETMASTERMLAVLSITALVAGAFVILNSFLMSLGERKRNLAILRSLGATRKQVTRLLLTEALALGTLGTVVGIPLGLGMALVVTHLIARFSGTVVPQLRVTAGPLALAGLLGIGVAVLATYFPARTAGRRSPLAALRERPETSPARTDGPRRWPARLGLALLAFFALVYAAIVCGLVPDGALVFILPAGMVLALVGSALATPVALTPLSRVTERLLRPILGIEASLANRQLRRHPTRTSLVVSVLIISVMLSTGFGNAMLNSVRDTREWMVRIFADVDFLVVPTALTGTELLPVAMPEDYADRIARIEGVQRVGKGTVFSTFAEGRRILIFTRSCRPGEDPGFRIVDGVDEDVRRRLQRGEVVIGTALAQRLGRQPGDAISIETRHGIRKFRIAGLTSEYTAGGMIALVEWDYAKKLFDTDGIRYAYVVAEPDARARVQPRLQAFCDEHHLVMHSSAGFTAACDDMIAGVTNSAWVLLALVFVVASLGITNCVTMNVFEQTRELGVLRAIAMKRGQIRKMILSQALSIGVISTVPGVLLGILLGCAMTSASYATVGSRIPYRLEPTLLLACAIMALVVAALAALPPAHRAGRLKIIRALHYE